MVQRIHHKDSKAVKVACQVLEKGGIIVYPTDTLYGFGCDAKNINSISILDNGKALDILQLASLIKESLFVIANDTGPAHISAHLGVKGLTLFGKHTTAYKVSIERENFKAIQVDDLEKLSAAKVLEKILI